MDCEFELQTAILNHYWKPFIFQKLVCSAASRLLQESFYPGTTLPCSISSFPGIYSIQELLCSAASRVFQETFYPGTTLLCSISSFPGIFLSSYYSARQHPVSSRNLPIQELFCSAASRLFQELLCSAASVYSRNIFHLGTVLLCSIPSITGIYSI